MCYRLCYCLALVFLLGCAEASEPEWDGRAIFKRDLIKRYGHSRYLNAFAAQIKAESNWKANAVSWVGAYGCGQFMPATQGDSKYWAKDLGDIDWGDCTQNARASIRYMKAIHRRISGDKDEAYKEAVKDYNRGMGWGDKERNTGTCLRSEQACEETANYVKKIFGRFQDYYYSLRYGNSII